MEESVGARNQRQILEDIKEILSPYHEQNQTKQEDVGGVPNHVGGKAGGSIVADLVRVVFQ